MMSDAYCKVQLTENHLMEMGPGTNKTKQKSELQGMGS